MAIASVLQAQKSKSNPPAKFTERVNKQITHEILMLPNYGTFDALGFKVDGYNVTLLGRVVNATLKSDLEHQVKKIEGVEKVINKIEILPASMMDDRLRQQLFRAIYGYAPLQHYGVGSNRPIHIIVKRGHVTLEGVVDSNSDKNLAYIRANGVPGVFSVTNHLMVPGKKK
jgi:osmotically-inducible protein OsmY